MVQRAAIFGAAGAIGRATAAELERRGIPFRAVGRNRATLERAFGGVRGAEIVAADLGDLRAATEAARGADTIIYAVGVPYYAFHLHPQLMRITVDAAAAAGVSRLVLVSSVYSYGVPQTRKVGEDHPRMPETYKGRMRKEQEDITFEAQRKGQLPALVVRLPDFYGIHADNSLANPILRAALAGKTATWFGPVDAPHEFMFVSDAGTVIVELATRNDAYGEAWNFAGPGEITPREFMIKAYAVLGRQPKFRTLGRTMLKVAGWFKPEARELIEMLYLQERPVLLDDSKLQRLLGTVHKTSYEEGIHRTMDWMRAGGGAAG